MPESIGYIFKKGGGESVIQIKKGSEGLKKLTEWKSERKMYVRKLTC